MNSKLNRLISLCRKRVNSFKDRQDGILATEYALIIATLGVLFIAAFRESGSFYEMFHHVWLMISTKVLAALNAII